MLYTNKPMFTSSSGKILFTEDYYYIKCEHNKKKLKENQIIQTENDTIIKL